MLITIFTEALQGDGMAQQHALWLMAKPAFWWFVLKWTVLIVALVGFCIQLSKRGLHLWSALLPCAGTAALWGVILLAQHSASLIAQGRISDNLPMQSVNLLTTILAAYLILRTFWCRIKRHAAP